MMMQNPNRLDYSTGCVKTNKKRHPGGRQWEVLWASVSLCDLVHFLPLAVDVDGSPHGFAGGFFAYAIVIKPQPDTVTVNGVAIPKLETVFLGVVDSPFYRLDTACVGLGLFGDVEVRGVSERVLAS